MEQMQYLQIFADKEELLEPFDDAERGRLFSAMLRYALHCEETPLTGNERFVWPVFKQMIDQSREVLSNKRKAGVARQQAAAESSSAQQTAADDKQAAAQDHINKNQESRNKNNNKNNNNGGEDKRARNARFIPPSVQDVEAFAKEHGYTLNAEQFVDFYTAKGWRIGAAPMRDWKAAARNWVRRDSGGASPPGKRTGAQQYTQRAYDEKDLEPNINDFLEESRRLGYV